MNIDRLSPSASMLELVRVLSKRAPKTSAQNVYKDGAAPKSSGELDVLRSRLAEIVTGVDAENEQTLGRIRRSLFQEIVLWEFGADFRQHPEFASMLDTLERAFEADPRASSRFAVLIRDLKR